MLFDLHCDTLFELEKNGKNLEQSQLAVSLENMEKFDRVIRCFAIFTPDELKGQEAKSHFDRLYAVFEDQLELYKDRITQITDKVSLEKAKIGAVLTVENGSVLAGSLCEIERLARLGVKLFNLTWNGENELGFGQAKNRGLKPFGKECVPLLEQNSITIDVSHLSDKGFEDVCKLSKKPLVASHSNSSRVCPHRRNLADEQIKEIVDRGGLIGLNLYTAFLNNDPKSANKYDILRHTEHILELGGENALCIGTDFDGAEIIDEFDSDEKLLSLEEFFIENGFSKHIADKILFNNAYNFFVNNL
ncbi:MAG: membrane dipeptidase [Oscillospiraceae bacterium]|nr:membrane dipeptidase [Oscillospiraceae bacterium]